MWPSCCRARWIGAGSGLSAAASPAPTTAPKCAAQPRWATSARRKWPALLDTTPCGQARAGGQRLGGAWHRADVVQVLVGRRRRRTCRARAPSGRRTSAGKLSRRDDADAGPGVLGGPERHGEGGEHRVQRGGDARPSRRPGCCPSRRAGRWGGRWEASYAYRTDRAGEWRVLLAAGGTGTPFQNCHFPAPCLRWRSSSRESNGFNRVSIVSNRSRSSMPK